MTVIAIAALDVDAVMACLATIPRPLHEQVIVIDNSRAGMQGLPVGRAHRARPHRHPSKLQPLRQLGISRSVNIGAALLDADADDVLLWVSTSMRFDEGGAHRLIEATRASTYGVIGMPHTLHAFGMRSAAFAAAGLWDENFFPAYYEDTDWLRRLRLATGLADPLPLVHIGGTCRDGHGYDVLRSLNPGRMVVNFDALKAYYAGKWGGCPPESIETFARPWGDKPLDYWPDVSIAELIERYGLGV